MWYCLQFKDVVLISKGHFNYVIMLNVFTGGSAPATSTTTAAPASATAMSTLATATSVTTTGQPLVNDRFTRDQTLYLIDLMRKEIEKNEEGNPKTIAELEKRMKFAKGGKKLLWEKLAKLLKEQFQEHFLVDKVRRKWNTLVEGYTNATNLPNNHQVCVVWRSTLKNNQ